MPNIQSKRLAVLYEDNEIIVIDKPAGMLAVSTEKENEHTAYRMVTDYVRKRRKGGRVFIVHRLDRETSGIMLFAKDEKTKYVLQDNWEKTAVFRGYSALVEGRADPGEGKIESWLKQTKTLFVYSSKVKGDGKLAITHFNIEKAEDKYSLLNVELKTGRKNQIRVHMGDIGHPVAGDGKYGAKTNPINRLGLHASALTIIHPKTGEQIFLKSKTPDIFFRVFKP